MATIRRCEVLWTGLVGLPGVSVFYAPAGTDPSGDLVTFFNAIKAQFPTGLSWGVPGRGDELNDATGALTGGWTGAGGATVLATGDSHFAAGCGAYVNWPTGTIVSGRRLRGRTFLAPIKSQAYETNGTIDNAVVTALLTAAQALAATNHITIWHRPDPVSHTGGSSALANDAAIPDQVTSLRTRRR
jgi:hypothetical protein